MIYISGHSGSNGHGVFLSNINYCSQNQGIRRMPFKTERNVCLLTQRKMHSNDEIKRKTGGSRPMLHELRYST